MRGYTFGDRRHNLITMNFSLHLLKSNKFRRIICWQLRYTAGTPHCHKITQQKPGTAIDMSLGVHCCVRRELDMTYFLKHTVSQAISDSQWLGSDLCK